MLMGCVTIGASTVDPPRGSVVTHSMASPPNAPLRVPFVSGSAWGTRDVHRASNKVPQEPASAVAEP